jgi:hypothetical protein
MPIGGIREKCHAHSALAPVGVFGDACVRLARAMQPWVISHNPAAVLRPGDGPCALRVYQVLGNLTHVCLLHVTQEFSLDTLTRDDHFKITLL